MSATAPRAEPLRPSKAPADNRPLTVVLVERPDDGGQRWDRAIAIILEAGRQP